MEGSEWTLYVFDFSSFFYYLPAYKKKKMERSSEFFNVIPIDLE